MAHSHSEVYYPFWQQARGEWLRMGDLCSLGSLRHWVLSSWLCTIGWWKLDSPSHSQQEEGKREFRASCSPSMGQNSAPGHPSLQRRVRNAQSAVVGPNLVAETCRVQKLLLLREIRGEMVPRDS